MLDIINIRRRGQSWSFDLIIAGIIFILVITIFYTLLIREPKADIVELKQEGNYIANQLQKTSGPCGFIQDKEVDPARLAECFANEDVQDFKKEYNIKGHFCIYFVDKEGRLITVKDPTNNKHYVGFGDSDLEISGIPCGGEFTPP